jgi:hypothetical protein
MSFPFLELFVSVQSALTAPRDERGQSMAEYALLMLGVGLLAVFIFKWLQGSGLLQNLFGAVIGKILPG